MKRTLLITVAVVGMLCLACGQLFKIAAHPASHDKNAFTPETIPVGSTTALHCPGSAARRDRR